MSVHSATFLGFVLTSGAPGTTLSRCDRRLQSLCPRVASHSNSKGSLMGPGKWILHRSLGAVLSVCYGATVHEASSLKEMRGVLEAKRCLQGEGSRSLQLVLTDTHLPQRCREPPLPGRS